MDREEEMLKKRLMELSSYAYSHDRVIFSDFLNLNELNILHTIPKNLLPAGYETYGGYELSERQMAAFLPDALSYDVTYPIKAVRISPLNRRFSEELGHRDYLGSLMNLGIERRRLGDIVADQDAAFLFAAEGIAGYIAENLTRVRHTAVAAEVMDTACVSYTPRFETVTGTAASIRLDAVLAAAFPLSRSKLSVFIEGGKVFVNGKLVTGGGHGIQDGDVISARGLGRIVFDGVLSKTKKGRYLISIKKYY